MGDFLDDLRDAVGDRHVITDADVLAGHVLDWTGGHRGHAAALVRPASTDDVAAVVACARAHGLALVPQGGNTGLVAGGVPGPRTEQPNVVVHLGRIDDVAVDADAGTVLAGAGATLAAVQRAAEAAGWRYAVDLAARDSATIGGTVATNAGGLRVLRHGMTRRHLLGVEAVLGSGEVIRHLGGLVKDNTGYDLAGLLCGSEGTLGIVTRVRLGLVAPADGAVTALVGLASVADARRLVADLRRRVPTLEVAEIVLAAGMDLVAAHTGVPSVLDPVPPVALLVEATGPPDPAPALAAVLEGTRGLGEVAVATDPARAARLWEVRERHTEAIAAHAGPGGVHKYDVTLPAERLDRFVAEVPRLVHAVAPDATTWLFGHLGDGNIHVNVTGAPAEAVDDVTAAVLGRVVADAGSISAEHGIGRAKRDWLTSARTGHEIAAMAAIKAALDPDGVCNPGVLLPAD